MFMIDSCLVCVLFIFNCWSWFMACSGMTLIELTRQNTLFEDEQFFDFSFDTIKDNLFVLFGTHKLLRILSPSMRSLPLNGLEWSFLVKEEGFDEDGYRMITETDQHIELTQLTSNNSGQQESKKQSVLVDEFDQIDFGI